VFSTRSSPTECVGPQRFHEAPLSVADLPPLDGVVISHDHYVHLDPEEAVAAHQALRGDLLVPIHWGTFNLALHSWTDPAERLLAASDSAGVRAAIPRPGESVSPAGTLAISPWWRDVDTALAKAQPRRAGADQG